MQLASLFPFSGSRAAADDPPMRDAPSSSPPASRLVALFAASAGLLLLQLALTKIFSIVLWYHFGFLVISIALLGFAISGVRLARQPEVLKEGGPLLARLSGWAAAGTALALWILVHTRVDAFSVISDRNEGGLLLQIAVLLVPFFFLGAVVSCTLTMHRDQAGKVYSANLLGSGAGCALALVLFDGLHLSAPDVVLFCGLLIAVAGVLFSGTNLRAARWPGIVGAALLALFAWDGRHDALHLQAPKSKPLWHVEEWERKNTAQEVLFTNGDTLVFDGRLQQDGDDFLLTDLHGDARRVTLDELEEWEPGEYLRPHDLVEFTEWTSLSRVDAFTWVAGEPWGLWGLSRRWTGGNPRQKGITIDSWAMTNVLEWGGGELGEEGEPPEILEFLPASLVHRVRPEAEILCIGAGGGMDLLTAKRFGAKKITGVEINPGVVRAVRSTYLDFQGGLYDPERNPGVELHVAEGRHFLERDDGLYDVVQLSGVDTASTTQAGAFSLSENFLYTKQAFETYLERTKTDGLVTLTRWVLPDSEGYMRNTLRLFTLAWAALESHGVSNPAECIYLIQSQGYSGPPFSVILFGRQPFTEEELATLDRTCGEKDFQRLYHPARASSYVNPSTGLPVDNQFELFAQAPDKDEFLAAYPYDVAPPTDGRPFFFETSRFRHLFQEDSFFNVLGGITAHGILAILLGLTALISWVFVIAPLRKLRARGDGAGLPVVLYFAALGLGFILVEVVLSQKFILYLGNPLYALSVVLFSVLIFSGGRQRAVGARRRAAPRTRCGDRAGRDLPAALRRDLLRDARPGDIGPDRDRRRLARTALPVHGHALPARSGPPRRRCDRGLGVGHQRLHVGRRQRSDRRALDRTRLRRSRLDRRRGVCRGLVRGAEASAGLVTRS